MNDQLRLQQFNDTSYNFARMTINTTKTKRMVIKQKDYVSKTVTEEDIVAANPKFSCIVCDRKFFNKKGVAAHKRFCNGPGNGNSRKRKNQIADKIIKAKKRQKIIENAEKIYLNGNEIDNVYSIKYLGSTETHFGGSEDEVETKIIKALNIFKMHSNIWKRKKLNIDLKIRLFKVRILSIFIIWM